MPAVDAFMYKVKVLLKRCIPALGIKNNRVPKSIWEKQFSNTTWDYLESEDERGHYDLIREFYRKYADGMSVLDIGCGKGVLYKYLEGNTLLDKKNFTGIDISENAVIAAGQRFPGVDFRTVDYQFQSVDKRYTVVIFNETLYYFNNPLETLAKCCAENLVAGGKVIISMCEYDNNDEIWSQIEKEYLVLDEDVTINNKGKIWTVKIITRK